MLNAKLTTVLCTIALLAVATPVTTQAQKINALWECFNPGDTITPVVRAWTYNQPLNVAVASQLPVFSDGKSAVTDSENPGLALNGGINMNNMEKFASIITKEDFSRGWYIPTFTTNNDGTLKLAWNRFYIVANSVGKFYVPNETNPRFIVNCKQTQ